MSAAEPSEHLPGELAHELTGHEGAVLAVRFNTQGTYCMSCGKDRTIKLWNPAKGLLIKTYTGHGYEVRDVSVSRDNSQLASCGGDRQIFLWDVSTGRVIRKFRGHDSKVNAVRHGGDDEVLVSAGYDQCVRVWDCRSRSQDPIQTMCAFKDDVMSVTVQGAEIIAGSVDGTVRRFDIRRGRVYTDDLHHPVTHVAVSHDQLCVLAACLDSQLRLLDKGTGELLATYTGHQHESVKMECAITPSDAYVIGSSEDGSVLYWDLVEANVVHKFQAHTGVVCSLAIHPQATYLLTSSTDGTVKVWA
eukprot:jgi/Chrzof1/3098/Cz12g11190.t1